MTDERMLEKISKLLAQAEGTSNKAEAEAYSERAQFLAAQYSIDLELARYRQKSKTEREELTTKRIVTGEPNRQYKNRWWVDLFLEIARVNDLRCTIAWDRAAVHAYGYPSDIAVAEMLFASLNTQMVGLCGHALRRGDHKEIGVHGATYRLNFYEAFINEIGRRLQHARRQAMNEQRERDAAAATAQAFAATMEDGSAITEVLDGDEAPVTGALVMVKKQEAVHDFYEKATAGKLSRGGYRSIAPKTVSYGAQAHGRAAGSNASLGARGSLPGPRPSIGQ